MCFQDASHMIPHGYCYTVSYEGLWVSSGSHMIQSKVWQVFITISEIKHLPCNLSWGTIFRVSFQPNAVYRLATEQSSRIEIESQKKNQAANQPGAENQSVTETTSKHLSSITTGPMKPDQSFSWKMVFDSIGSTKAVNQKPATVKNFIEGLAVEGTYDKTNRLHIDSVTLNTIDENLRAEIKAAAECPSPR